MASDLSSLFICFIFYSFCGWLFEVVYCSVKEGQLINRGFLNGPYCPIYGAGAMLAVMLFPAGMHPLALFFACAFVCSIIEYLTSYAMERAFHARWWDYTGRFMNINGRVCLAGFTLFGLACIFVLKISQPTLEALLRRLPENLVIILGGLFFVVFVADIVITNAGLSNLRARFDAFYAGVSERTQALYESLVEEDGALERLKGALPQNAATDGVVQAAQSFSELVRSIPRNRVVSGMYERLKERGVDISPSELFDAFQNHLNDQERRIFAAFPHLQSIDYKEEFAKLRAKIDPRVK